MASFAGVSFNERGDNATTFPTFGRRGESTVLHPPGGNTNIIQTAGLLADTLALRIRCTKAQHDSLRSKVHTSGTLSYSYGSRTAFLDSISDAHEIVDSGLYFATLNFIGQ